MLSAELLTDRHHEAYNAFLTSLDDSLLYYSLEYKAFLEELLGCHSHYCIALEDAEVVGILPVMERAGPWGKVLNSLPFYGSNGGIIARSRDVCDLLAKTFDELASKDDVAAATMIEHPLHLLSDSSIRHDLVDERIGQVTPLDDLAESPAFLYGRIDGAARRNIRKAERCGVEVCVDNSAVGFLRTVHTENMRAIDGKAKSLRFFETFPKYFEAGLDYNIYLASRAGEPIAALLLFYFNRTVEYYTPVVVSEHREHQPTALILRTAMIDAAKRGFLYWNWGGTWRSQEGVWRFKNKWGAKDRPYRYYIKVNDSDILYRSRDDLLTRYADFYVVPFDQLRGV